MSVNIENYLDNVAIREVLSCYSICVDTWDNESYAARFTADGLWQWEAAGLNFRGRGALKMIAAVVAKHANGTQHAITNWIIDIDGYTAMATSRFTCFLSRLEKIYCLMLGYYQDQLIRK